MASLTKRPGSPYWWLKYYPCPGAKPVRKSTGIRHDGKRKPHEAAEALRREIETSLARSRMGYGQAALPNAPGTIVTVADWLPQYIDGLGNSATSRQRYQQHVNHFIRWAKANNVVTITQIDGPTANNFADFLKGKGLANPQVIVNILEAAMANARARGLACWAVNPFEG